MSSNPSGSSAARARPRIPRRHATGWAPLSLGQQGLWSFHQSQPLSPLHNVARAFRIYGILDLGILRRALEALVARHEILRTIYVSERGQPIQVIRDEWTFDLEQIDLSDLEPGRRELAASRLTESEARRPFDLSTDLVLRGALVRMAPECHILIMVTHRIAADDRSMNILVSEVSRLYETFQAGNGEISQGPPIQYGDYAAWQRRNLAAGALEPQFAFWKERLSGMLPVRLPSLKARPASTTFRGARHTWTISRDLQRSIVDLCRSEQATPFEVFFASFAALLSRYTGQDDIAIGSPSALQTSADIDPLVGYLTNTLVLRTSLAGNPTFRALLRRVRETKLQADAHPELPLETVMQEISPEHPSNCLHLLPVTFTHQVNAEAEFRIAGALVYPVPVETGVVQSDLRLSFVESADGLAADFQYRPEVLDTGFVRRMADHLDHLLESALQDPNRRLSELRLMPEAEFHRIVFEWNPPAASLGEEPPVPRTIEIRAADLPGSIAVDDGQIRLSYRELNRRANQVARFLGRLGMGRGAAIGFFAERSVSSVVGLIGILKAGCVCVPLNGRDSSGRLDFILEDAGIRCILVSSEGLVRYSIGNPDSEVLRCKVVLLDSGWSQISRESPQNVPVEAQPGETAYVVYPPGSPGVVVSQRAIGRHCLALIEHYHLVPQDRVLLLTPHPSDAPLEQILLPLLCGSSVVLAGTAPQNLAELRITVAFIQLSAWGQFVNVVNGAAGSSVRLVIAGGERLRPEDLVRLHAAPLNSARLLSAYGQPETLSTAATFEIPYSAREVSDGIPIGRPPGACSIYILDRYMQPVPAGIPGELYVGGESIALGYMNDPQATAMKFVPNPFSTAGGRLFRTGDLARFRSDGSVELWDSSNSRISS